MEKAEITVPFSLIQKAADHCSTALIDTHDPRKSKAKVFSWNGRAWTCVGLLSQGANWHYAEVIEVVLEQFYTGPAHRRGGREYTGARFKCSGQVWVITANVIRLIPDGQPEEAASQLSLFA